LLRRLLGVRTEVGKKAAKVVKLSKGEILMVNIGSLSTGGRVTAVKGLELSRKFLGVLGNCQQYFADI